MASNLAFNIFARDVNASKTLDEVGDNAERLERRLKGVGDGASGLQARFRLLGDGATGLTLRLNGIGGGAAAAGVSLVSTAGKIGFAAAAMSSAATSAAGLVTALAPAAGAVAALPAGIVLFQGALATLKVALIGVSDAFEAALGDDPAEFEKALEGLAPAAANVARELHGLKPALDDIKNSVQDALFAPLQGQLTALVETLGGPVKEGMTGLAGQFGELAVQAGRFGQSAAAVNLVNGVFGTLRGTLADIGATTLERLLQAMARFATSTLPAFDGLGQAVDNLAVRFANWLDAATQAGKPLQWIENAKEVFRQLGAIAGDVGGILKGVFTAMQAAGSGGALGAIGQLLDGLGTFANSTAGQAALTEIFKAIGQIGKSLQPVVAALVTGLGELAPVVGELAKQIGPILTAAISGLVPALKALGPGVVVVFQALGQAVGELASSGALTEIGQALADILVALAPLLPALAQILVPALQGLAFLVTNLLVPALQTVVGWITGLVNKLSGASLSEDSWLVRLAFTIRDAVIPIWQRIQEVVGKVVADIAKWVQENQGTIDGWGERIISIVGKVGDIIAKVFEYLSVAWDKFGGPLLDLVGGVFGAILQVIDGTLTAIQGIVEIFIGVVSGDWSRAWEGVKTVFSGVWEAIKGILGAAWEAVKYMMSAGMIAVGAKWDETWSNARSIVQTAWNAIVSWIAARVADVKAAIGRLAEIPGQVSAWFGRVKDSIVDRLNDAVAFVRGIPGRIVDAFGSVGNLLYNAGRSIIQGLIDGLYSMLQNAYNAAADILGQIRNLFPFSPAKEGPFSGKGWTLYAGMSLAEGFAEGMAKGRGLVGDAAAGLAGAASFGVTTPVSPVVPAGVAPGGVLGGASATFVFNFAGQPLIGRDEIARVVMQALAEARGRGFNVQGAVVGAS